MATTAKGAASPSSSEKMRRSTVLPPKTTNPVNPRRKHLLVLHQPRVGGCPVSCFHYGFPLGWVTAR